jgi:hypothetical protein
MTLSGMVNVEPANATSGTNSDGTKSGAAALSGLSFAAVAAMVLAGAAQL